VTFESGGKKGSKGGNAIKLGLKKIGQHPAYGIHVTEGRNWPTR
jgi:hypothetical protein